MNFRRLSAYLLARKPRAYERLLRWRGRSSFEKLLFCRLVHDGDRVLDIGANQGHFTLHFSDLVGSRGHVHAFEPVRRTFEALQQNVRAGAVVRNITLHNVACTERPGEFAIYLPDDDSGQASLRGDHTEGSWASHKRVTEQVCRGVTVDEYLPAQGDGRVDFLKCDVEGAELLAMRGAERLLREQQPLLFLEVCTAWTRAFDYTPADLFRYLGGAGYDRFAICGDEHVTLLEPLATPPFDDRQGVNLLAGVAAKHECRIRAALK